MKILAYCNLIRKIDNNIREVAAVKKSFVIGRTITQEGEPSLTAEQLSHLLSYYRKKGVLMTLVSNENGCCNVTIAVEEGISVT